MIRRLLTSLIVVAIAGLPALSLGASAQLGEASFSVHFSCYKDGSARLTGENHYSDKSISMTVLSQTGPNTFEELGSIDLGPGESKTLDIGPGVRFGAWDIPVESLVPGEGTLYTVPYPRDCFPFSDPEPGITPGPTIPAPTATLVPDPNSFTLLTSQRMCADQSFRATWSAANVVSLQFSLSNTSDDWTSGWFDAEPAAGSLVHEVDHHSYDKVMAEVAFEDGTSETLSVNVGACTEAPAPPPPSSGGTSAPPVTSLPSTGSGSDVNTIIAFSALALIAGTILVAGTLRHRR